MTFDLEDYLAQQIVFSKLTFGPGSRVDGVIDHILKELQEVLDNPESLEEWVDIMILAFDGAWRAGHDPYEICQGLKDKLAKNRSREWPDWRTAPVGKAIEHVRRP